MGSFKKKNVADEATKWQMDGNLGPDTRWFTGPQFLYDDESTWPVQSYVGKTVIEEELRAVHHHRKSVTLIQFDRFSKFERIVRAIAYVYRFIKLCRKNCPKNEMSFLSHDELHSAEITVFRVVQEEFYPEEMRQLRQHQSQQSKKQTGLKKTSILYKLSPFLDRDGLIRLDSRINNALCLSFETKNPIILPKGHRLTKLLIELYHRKYGHRSNETVVNEIGQKYHISHLRTVVRKIARNCVWCRMQLPILPGWHLYH